MLKTPVLFLIFNRPDVTFRVFEEIRKAQPEKLFIAADGPRHVREGEKEKCEAARSVIEKIDWKCEVKTLFREKNLGCRDAVSSAITWFFENVEDGIILEDDCLPDQSFFNFCEVILEKYRLDNSIVHINGSNFQNGNIRGKASYYFSNMPSIWGWATWRRSWKNYDLSMKQLEQFKNEGGFKKLFKKKYYTDYYYSKLIQTKQGKINTWDYQWAFSIWKNNGIVVTPNVNLVSNIGFGTDATHTTTGVNFFSELKKGSIKDIIHPTSNIKADEEADLYLHKLNTGIKDDLEFYRKRFYNQIMKSGSLVKQKIKTKGMTFAKKLLNKLLSPLIQDKVTAEIEKLTEEINTQKLLAGLVISKINGEQSDRIIKNIQLAEFKVFSQWGDDGIIDFLVDHLQIRSERFIEFGVENYRESNTRFLLLKRNWKGLVFDSSSENIEYIKADNIYWKHDLTAKEAFITRENINQLISENNFAGEIGLLHIDIDGNDYWIWEAIEVITPTIVIVEYNSIFGSTNPWTIPYHANFERTKYHYSNLYFGSSLLSLCDLASAKGYIFIGCNSSGNNAYFVNKEKNNGLISLSAKEGFVSSKFRESRDSEGNLTYISENDRLKLIKGLNVYNTREKITEII